MSDIAIKVEGLSKRYKIGKLQRRHDTLRDRIADARVFNLFKRRNGTDNNGTSSTEHSALSTHDSETLWALRDVSFEVRRGEVVGIIGRNGAGKSTLLKILSRITEPTEGFADINGRVASLLEVGTGFNTELTGRENIYLNGSILGMRRAEINSKFDEIVAFAEVEKFIDTPVKRYSSGMYLRLAFAVAAHLDPEILMVDEVLAVGDAAFQKKCLGKMSDVAREGRTVLFVSHNIEAVCGLCERAALFDGGRLIVIGDTADVVAQYLGANSAATAFAKFPFKSSEARFCSATLCNTDGNPLICFPIGDSPVLRCEFQLERKLPGLEIAFAVLNFMGDRIFYSSNAMADLPFSVERAGVHSVTATIPPRLLLSGRYFVNLALHRPNLQLYDYHEKVLTFEVIGRDGEYHGFTSSSLGYVNADVVWREEELAV